MNELDPEKLIQAIKVRPALYNRNDSTYYSHKKYKIKMWNDVCREVYGNFDNLKPQEKVEFGHELQKRWKSLRTCFTRELAVQKREKNKRESDGPVKRRKKYEYFDQMTFLLNPEDKEENDEPVKDSDDDTLDPLEGNLKTEDVEVFVDPSGSVTRNTNGFLDEPMLGDRFQPYTLDRHDDLDQKILRALTEMKRDEEDEDKQFLLSLIPSFKKLNDKQKLEARIEILKVIKNISFQDNDSC